MSPSAANESDQRRSDAPLPDATLGVSEDELLLRSLGYRQELLRRMSGFSNFAISLSIICILAGGVTSFHVGLCSVGGAAIGLGWPIVCLFSLVVALTMGQIASAFPTAGGLYHWASILGGRGWGWVTAWFNLAGLVTVLAAINVGLYQFVVASLGFRAEEVPVWCQHAVVGAVTISQAVINHRGIELTTRLTDFSGYWILGIACLLTVTALGAAPVLHWDHLITFTNLSGPVGGDVWPRMESISWLFLLGFLLPAYTITGFDASAHTSEETVQAAHNVPRAIVRSVLVSGVAGWVMLAAIVAAAPDLPAAAMQGSGAFVGILRELLPKWAVLGLTGCIAVAQYLCGLATVTSASRMTYAFARDGGLPFSRILRQVSDLYRTPPFAIWAVSLAAILFTLYTPVYSTITLVCAIFLYVSYVIPTGLGFATFGRTWTKTGPWNLGRGFRPLAVVAVVGCAVLIALGVSPPNQKALWITVGSCLVLGVAWLSSERRRFPGPPPLDPSA